MRSPNNARHAIEVLLTTETCRGKYLTASEITFVPVPEIILHDGNLDERCAKLSFPLDDNGVAAIKERAERAGVGTQDATVVNLDVRKTWQIKPRNLHVSNFERAVESALRVVARDLGTEVDYEIKANLYKLLLYEPGCFFARHRDSERLDGMFATLVLELPSIYEGAELSVYSPLTPGEKETYTFNGGGNAKSNTKRQSNRLCSPKLHFAAFYADCYHEVSKLTSGHRVALVYHLTANPRVNRLLPHLPVPSPSPPQPADESIARRLSKLVEMFSKENDNAYPNETSCDGKPKKLVVVLSHNYSPASLTGIQSLKGSDRSIAELIRAAACYPPKDVLTSLTNLAARKVVEEGGERYATDPECSLSHELVSNALKRESSGPYFDAVISLANVWDEGECTPYSDDTFCTTGSLISITADHSPLDLGPELQYDIEAAYHQSWFGGEDHLGPPFQYHGPTDDYGMPLYNVHGRLIYGEQFLMDDEWTDYRVGQGNHVIPIYSHELLFASKEASRKYFDDILQWGRKKHKKKVIVDEPQAVEFFGNGMQYMGRVYSRAVIMIWPKTHRRDIQIQSRGGRAIIEGAK